MSGGKGMISRKALWIGLPASFAAGMLFAYFIGPSKTDESKESTGQGIDEKALHDRIDEGLSEIRDDNNKTIKKTIAATIAKEVGPLKEGYKKIDADYEKLKGSYKSLDGKLAACGNLTDQLKESKKGSGQESYGTQETAGKKKPKQKQKAKKKQKKQANNEQLAKSIKHKANYPSGPMMHHPDVVRVGAPYKGKKHSPGKKYRGPGSI